MGWREREYARFTREERERFYGADAVPRRRASGRATCAGGAGFAVAVSSLLFVLGQVPHGHPVVPALHFRLPGVARASSSHAPRRRVLPLRLPAVGAVSPGALFFCVRGANVDGHELAPQAVEAGAAALVVERTVAGTDVPQIVVADSRAAMAVAADVFFGRPTHELEVAGVTGTNGKTTTAHLVYAILAAAGHRPGLLGTIEARLAGERRPVVRTTPEAIDLQRTFREMLDAGDKSCAMEASSHASELHRLDRVRFAALVLTNLT